MQERSETWVQSLGWEDPLGEVMATHSSILAWEIPWTEDSGAPVHGAAKSQMQLNTQSVDKIKVLLIFQSLSISNEYFHIL